MRFAVVLDTDFLSAFLKIERLQLVRDLYRAETLLVPPAVFREVSLTRLLPQLASLSWVHLAEPGPEPPPATGREGWEKLGPGEKEAIALAISQKPSMLLTNDRQATRMAMDFGIDQANVPAFLLSCKLTELVGRQQLAEIVRDLEEKDRHTFRRDLRELLLS